jgi:hypothetical protein
MIVYGVISRLNGTKNDENLIFFTSISLCFLYFFFLLNCTINNSLQHVGLLSETYVMYRLLGSYVMILPVGMRFVQHCLLEQLVEPLR